MRLLILFCSEAPQEGRPVADFRHLSRLASGLSASSRRRAEEHDLDPQSAILPYTPLPASSANVTQNVLSGAAIRTVPFKRSTHRPVSYLEKNEMEALLQAPDKATWIGRRDYGLLLFMYNSGARADEVAHLVVGDLNLRTGGENALSSVRLTGKGNKTRICPLWASTTEELKRLVTGRHDDERVFLNRCSAPLTRFGIHEIVTRNAQVATSRVPDMRRNGSGPT